MKQIILVCSLFLLCLPAGTQAETFSCRGKDGTLHVADNLMSLPADCRFQAETLDEKDPGKVNYVPPPKDNPQTSRKFQQELQLQQQEISARQQEAANLRKEADRLVTTYDNAISSRYKAVRSREYGSRETIQTADRDLQSARAEKAQLLDKLKASRIAAEQKDEIIKLLGTIQD
ncbi:hypothetical protein [Geopsychrobacter electrodiphilus]|uniref:hypothetical protein n=1 Tax=Geopsychrobacter electrodiphilus TaxID=225196 RepID=UPI00037C9E40|nr:hypothetical protein [Geopsychrobacter electrodiphilus]